MKRSTRSASTACTTAATSATARSSAAEVDAVRDYLVNLQQAIVSRFEALDGNAFITDEWKRAEGGGGVTRIIEQGDLLERGGVGFSHVTGTRLPPSASAHRPEIAGRAWEAMGVSL